MNRVVRMSAASNPVVVGFDGSPDGFAALRWAANDAEVRRVPLRVVRAWQWDDELAVPLRHLTPCGMEEVARTRTEVTLRELFPAVSLRPDLLDVVLSGDDPGRAILSATHDAAVAVLGRRRLSLRERLFVGSVGDFVLEHTACPTVVVPTGAGANIEAGSDTNPDQRFVVVGVDGSWEGRAALSFAAGEAARRNATLTILVAQFRSRPEEGRNREAFTVQEEIEEQQRLLRDAAEDACRLPGMSRVPLELQLGTDSAGPCLVSASAGGELLVVGSHGRGWLGRLALGSVSRYCVQHADVPVAVVPRP
jgi:nucleotide-binding universal stress UspA family protein